MGYGSWGREIPILTAHNIETKIKPNISLLLGFE